MRVRSVSLRPLNAPVVAHVGNIPPIDKLVVVLNRGGDGMGVSVKVARSGKTFRIEPARDPRAPRFWCLRVYPFDVIRGDVPASGAWWGAGGMTRAELTTAVDAIRADPTAWLSQSARSDLRAWMLSAEHVTA